MTADEPVPAAGAPDAGPALAAGGASAAHSQEPARQRPTSGTVVAALFYVPSAVVVTVLAVQAMSDHRWGVLAWFTWGAVGFLGIPGLMAIWLGRSLPRRRRPGSPPGIT